MKRNTIKPYGALEVWMKAFLTTVVGGGEWLL
jgi:hypothetical protein